MYRSTWNRWLKTLDGRRRGRPRTISRRLTLTDLESRDVPTGFNAGDLVLYRVGTGSAALTGTGTAVFLDDYTTAGSLIAANTVPLPTSATSPSHALTAIGTTAGDGLLSVSADGRYLLVTGYDIGTSGTVVATTPRVVGRVDLSGNIDTTTAATDITSNLREAASLDGGAIWTVGTTTGGPVRVIAGGQTGTSTALSFVLNSTLVTQTSLQSVTIFGNQLYVGASVSGLDGLASVGTGLPLTSGQTISAVPGFPASVTGTFPSPRQFVFTNANTLYVADSNPSGGTSIGVGGLQKWTKTNGVWSKVYTIAMPATTEGLYSVVADPNNPGTLYGVTSEASQNNLIQITDGGISNNSSKTIATAAPNEVFRGVAFAPKALLANSDTVGVTTSTLGTSAPINTSVTFTATVTTNTSLSPTGYVTFENGSTVLAIVPVTAGAGGTATAQYTTSSLPVAANTITAYYGGDTTYTKGSASASQTITAGTTTTTTVSSNNSLPTANGQSVTFTATIVPGTGPTSPPPVGSVTFLDNGVSLGSASVTANGNNGTAQLTVTTATLQAAGVLIPGSHTITAVYSGVGFVGSSGTTVQNVKPNAYGAGHIVIERLSDGVSQEGGAIANIVFLDERTTTGTLVQSIVLPATDNGTTHALTVGGGVLGDGLLSNSLDGRYLIVAGYDAPLGTLNTNSVPRVIGRIDSNGNIDTTTALTETGTGTQTNNIRDAASTDGVGVWAVGSNPSANLRFTTIGTSGASTAVNSHFGGTSNTSGLNAVTINPVNSQLLISGGAPGIDGVASVNTPVSGTLPTTPVSDTPTPGEVNLPGFPTTGTPFPQARQFVFSPTGNGDIIYVADSRTVMNTAPVAGFFGGLQVWIFRSGSYGLAGSPNLVISPDGANDDEGLVGVTGDFTDPMNPIFYGVTSEVPVGAPNKLVKITYSVANNTSTVTVLATAPANEYFSGAAAAPTRLGTTSDSIGVVSSNPSAPLGSAVSFTATVTGQPATTPTGWITFQKTVGTTTTTLAVVPLAAGNPGQATAVYNDNGTVTNTLGPVTITAIYGGDGTYVAKTGTVNQTVTGAVTTTAVTSNVAQPTANNQSVTFTATVTASGTNPGTPAGTVDFFDNGLPLNAAGTISVSGSGTTATATVTLTTGPIQSIVGGLVVKLTPGIHDITAVYNPNGAFAASSGAKLQPVKANAFGAGDLLVYRAGDGVNSLTVNGNTVYIDEYTSAAGQSAPVQSIVMPTVSASAVGAGGNQALITSSQQSVEGQLSLSGDGQYVYLTGYDTPPPGVAGSLNTDIHLSAAAAIPRTIGRIKYDGTIDTSMALTDLADGGSVRGVVSPDGTRVYATGATGGVRFVSSYSAATTTSTQLDDGTSANLNDLGIAGGQLYVAGGTTGNTKVSLVGSGLPTTSGQQLSVLNGIPTGTATAPGFPQGFFFTSLMTGPHIGPDTLYIADNGNFANGTITKWALVGSTWTLVDTITSGAGSDNPGLPSFDNVTGVVSGTTTTLYASYGNGGNGITGPGFLSSITDAGGYNAAIPVHMATQLFSAPTNETFRGVAAVPTQPTTVASVVVGDGPTAERSEVRSIAVTFSTPVTFAGGNSNAAAAFQLTRVQDNANVANLAAAVSTVSGQTVVTLTFSTTGNTNGNNTGTVDLLSANGLSPSLNDGRFTLTISSSAVTGANGFNLAGGGLNGNYVSPTDTLGGGTGQLHLFRIFGDSTGDGIVDQVDLGAFRSAFNSSSTDALYISYLDANNDTHIDQVDLGQFRARFNGNIF